MDLFVGWSTPSDESSSKVLSLLRIAKLTRLMKLLRVLRASQVMQRWRSHIPMSNGFQTITKYTFYVMMLTHWVYVSFHLPVLPTSFPRRNPICHPVFSLLSRACCFNYLALSEGEENPENVHVIANWNDGNFEKNDFWRRYSFALLWSVQALNAGATAHTVGEFLLATVVVLGGMIFLALLIGEIANVFTNFDIPTRECASLLICSRVTTIVPHALLVQT